MKTIVVSKRSPGVSLLLLLAILVSLVGEAKPAHAAVFHDSVPAPVSCPGDGIFTFQCTGYGVAVFADGKLVLQATFSQIAGPLSVAIATQQNQPIVSNDGISLWALKSDELQVHMDADPDGTKLIVSSGICGAIDVQQWYPVYRFGYDLVYLPVYQPMYPLGQPIYLLWVVGTVYVVQPGDTLFRIALRYGTTVAAIAAANGIVNVNRIYAGQQLIIP